MAVFSETRPPRDTALAFGAAARGQPVGQIHLLFRIRARFLLRRSAKCSAFRIGEVAVQQFSACGACVLDSRRGQLTERSGASKTSMNGSRRLRLAIR